MDVMSQDKPIIILDFYGGSGAWSRPYRDAGYDVRVITLPDYNIFTASCDNESLCFPKLSTDDESMRIDISDIYGILAAPPCTEFSIAKNGSHRKRDLALGMETVKSCLSLIWHCQENGRLKFWALENPVGLLRRFLGKPAFTFYQWQFGDEGIKRTDLWGIFQAPKPTHSVRPETPYFVKQYRSGKKNQFAWSAPNCPEWAKAYIDSQPDRRAALRALTPPGFAQAFYRANR